VAHPDYLRKKAVELRRTRRLTIDELADCLALPRTTIYYWVRDIEIPQTRRQSEARQRASDANRRRAKAKRDAAYRAGAEMYPVLMEKPTFRDFVCMYIGEGTKRGRNYAAVCNSDPAVVRLAQRWLLELGDKPLSYAIQFHADQSLSDLRMFWSRELEIDAGRISFQRKSNSNQLSGRIWRSRYGVLQVRCSDTYLKAKIDAWIDLVRSSWG
jgi:hypothetical protein